MGKNMAALQQCGVKSLAFPLSLKKVNVSDFLFSNDKTL